METHLDSYDVECLASGGVPKMRAVVTINPTACCLPRFRILLSLEPDVEGSELGGRIARAGQASGPGGRSY
jgi:hypothetical protein